MRSARRSSSPGIRRRDARGRRNTSSCTTSSCSPRHGELVDRGGERTGGGRSHRGQVAQRAARADEHLRPVGGDLDGDGRQHGGDELAESAAVAGRHGIARHQLARQARHAEPHARRPLQAVGVADHDLEAAAAEVEAERRAGVDHDAGADGAEDEAGLLHAGDHLDAHTGVGFDPVDDVSAVLGLAQRRRRAGDDLLGAVGAGEGDEAAHGGQQRVERRRRDTAGAGDDVAEAEHLLLLAQRLERAVGTGLDDEQVQRVAAHVEGGDAHQAGGGR